MDDQKPTQPDPDPDRTQRISHQKVVDTHMSGWPTTDPDRTSKRPPKPRLWRRLALVPAAVILVALAGCGPRFTDHSDPRYAPATPLHSAGLAPTHPAGPDHTASSATTGREPTP